MPGWRKTAEDRKRDSRVYGATWRRRRLECLRRANWRCEIRIEGVCIGAASQADHIDGADNDPQHRNLRAACDPCHKKVTAQQGQGFRAQGARVAKDPDPRPRTNW